MFYKEINLTFMVESLFITKSVSQITKGTPVLHK